MSVDGHRWLRTAVNAPLERAGFHPEPGPAEVVDAIAGCGVCHTDLGYLYDGVRTNHPLPLTPAHEVRGRVVAAGAQAAEWMGKPVIVPAVLPCLLTGLALIVSLALIVYRLFERRRHIDVHVNGLLLALSGKKFIPWTSLSGVASGAVQARFLGIPLATRYQAILYPAVGKPVRLDGTVDNLPELLTQVKARLYPRMLAACLKAFSEGQRLYFGNISINQAELRVTDGTPSLRNLPWGNIHRIRVESGLLVIESENDKPM